VYDMADNVSLPKEFLAERDARIFSLKKSGLSNQEIGKKFNMSATAVAAATKRQLNRLNTEAYLS
jgi:DNA-binding NarL/FixJ family response regulator